MPYRRLPKTDQARLAALKKAVETENPEFEDEPISFTLLQQAKTLLPQFENNVIQYNFVFGQRVEGNKKMKKLAKQARMYVSHFVQVLLMAVERGEMKKSKLPLYGFDENQTLLPRLISEQELYEVGKRVIEGEQKRISEGGTPINFPTVQKVKVFFEPFCDSLISKKTSSKSTVRDQQRVAEMRERIDELVLKIWDEIESFYSGLEPYEKMKACQRCGVVYYYRKGEKKLTDVETVTEQELF
ncbi:MAG: hypothetical protein MJ001_00155 [Paludibacteraceae bacterium]|nr:hypothetical protein [Paludibacteraceae bacterium]